MHVLIALAPALIFLIALWFMDSFRLVRPSAIALALLYGAAAALGCEALHRWLMPLAGLDASTFSRYVAPITEEVAKAAFIAILIARARVGFLVDAAVQGFAIGTGFAIVENATYLRDVGEAPLMLWAVRGLGTGVLHGATTAMAAIVGKAIADRHPRLRVPIVGGVALAVMTHSLYNHLLAYPAVAAVLMLLALPVVVVAVFERSEKATREWVGAGLDLDLTLLQLVMSDGFQATRFGSYLRALPSHFEGVVVADMFCLLRVELELAVQAKAWLIAHEAGLDLPVDDDLRAALAERDYLRRSIGRTGLLALEPLRVSSSRDHWHHHLLGQAGGVGQWRERFARGLRRTKP
ncbi:MAG TPA: PrsW family glutamic-type intramembrane protease [Vicinamibacterales bacterium]|nr:PrsW family glutamic-type intramembrane protease [Vicinamibacterales bacterium]